VHEPVFTKKFGVRFSLKQIGAKQYLDVEIHTYMEADVSFLYLLAPPSDLLKKYVGLLPLYFFLVP